MINESSKAQSSVLLFNRYINSFLIRRFWIPEEKIHRSIAWKLPKVCKTSIKISFQNTGETLFSLFCSRPFSDDDPQSAPICNVSTIGDVRMVYIEISILGSKKHLEFKLLSWILPIKGNHVMPFPRINPEIMKYTGNVCKCFDENFIS